MGGGGVNCGSGLLKEAMDFKWNRKSREKENLNR